MMRTSILMARPAPTRSISRSWSTRSSLACSSGLSVAISSRNSVPAWARSNLPSLRWKAPDERVQMVLLEGLGEVVEGAELHGGHGRAHGLHGGDEDHLHRLVDGLDALEDLDAVHAGQADVEQHQVDLRGAQHVEGGGP